MQTVVIVGSNRGIGLELVRHYSNLGNKVFALCRKTSEELNKINNVVVLGKGLKNKNKSVNIGHGRVRFVNGILNIVC